MALADVRTVMTQLKKGELHRFYYLYGRNISGVEALTKEIIKKAVGDNVEFALNKLSGTNLDVSEFRDLTEMMPMLSEYNCILVNDYNCETQREETNKALIEAIKEIPPQTVVIFNITGFDVKEGKKSVQGKNKKLADLAVKIGIACEQGIKTPNELAKEIASNVSARGSMITLPVARELAEMCLSDTLLISNEIDKLCAYAGSNEITAEIVHTLVSRQSDVTVYNLADAVAVFNKKAAFDALDELIAQRVNRGVILGSIYGSFIDMYRAACARTSGKGIPEVMNDFSYKWEFKVKNAFRDSSRMSVHRLRSCVAILRDTAVQLNSTACDEKTALEQAVIKMLMTKN
ncbi:MAG: DNA polymerase III subunit delta [Ruminococcus sp.]|nr:DNA polymerase III subunit delta [Ruminococcus sp.]